MYANCCHLLHALACRWRIELRVCLDCRTAEEVRSAGGKILQEPGAIGGIGTQVTKVADPDGWILAFVDNSDFLAELRKAGKK